MIADKPAEFLVCAQKPARDLRVRVEPSDMAPDIAPATERWP